MFTNTEHSGVLPTPVSLTQAPGGKSDQPPPSGTRLSHAEPGPASPTPSQLPLPGAAGIAVCSALSTSQAVPPGLCRGCPRKLLLMCSLFLRVGVPAPGDRLPGNLPVPSLDAVCTAQGHPHVPGRRVGLPVADFQNHAWSGEYNLYPLMCRGYVPSCHFPEVHGPVSETLTPPRPGEQKTLREAPITPAPCPPRVCRVSDPTPGRPPVSPPDLPV